MRKSISFVLISVLIWQLIFVVNIVICEENVSPKVSHSAAPKLQVKVDSAEDVADRSNPESNTSQRKINVNSGKSEQSDEDDKVLSNNTKESKSPVVAGVQRRPSASGSTNGTKRDSQLLLLLAARRRQLLTERLTSHLATIATFAQKPAKHNVTSAQLEIRDFNNTVIRRISLPDPNSSATPENRFKNGFDQQVSGSRPVLRVDSFAGRPTTQSSDSKSSEVKSAFNTKALQDAKIVRAGYLNSRRKPASDVVRFGHGTRKPLIDLSVISHETYGIPEFKKDSNEKSDSKEAEAILDPDEEFQVDESNHGIYLLNYSTNNSMIQNPNETIVTPISDPEFLNIDFTTIPTVIEAKTKTKNITIISPEIKESLDGKILNGSIANQSQIIANDNKTTKANKVELPLAAKQIKVDTPPKDSENNTLFLSDELYNHFRPLESELAVEDMAPFLFFGQKITMAVPKDNLTTIHLTPTKPTLYVRPQDKKRGTYRPATEKIKVSPEENEDEINENMDVSVVKNVIEKNKIRNTIKMTAPSRHGNLVNAYRKQTFNDTNTQTTTASTIIDNSAQPSSNEEIKDSAVKIKDVGLNRTSLISLRNGNNRTYYNFRRKPAKLVQLLNETVKETVSTIVPTTPLPSTVVYTAVVTSVSVTSSIKGQNKNDSSINNSTISEDILTTNNNITNKDKSNNLTLPGTIVKTVDYSTTEKSFSTTTHRIQTVSTESIESNKTVNETIVNKYRKKPDRIRPTNRPRIRFTPSGKTNLENTSHPSPTPFILYSDKSAFSPIPRDIYKPVNAHQLPNFKYRILSTTERTVRTDISSSERPLPTESGNFKILSSTQPPNNGNTEDIDGVRNKKCTNDKTNSSSCDEKKETILEDIQSKDAITESNIFKISKDLSSDPKPYNISDTNNSYLYISNIPISRQNISTRSGGVLYEDSITTELSKEVEIHLLNESSPIIGNANISLLDKKDPKEVLQRRNGDVLIEMEKTNMATYILAGLSFLPITIIIMFVLRHVFLKKTKDIDTEYEGYFQDSNVKKETQITTVARPPILPPTKPDEKWEFPRSKLRLQTLLGQGNFGQVWKAEADDLTGHDGLTRLVAVKTIKETASQKEKQELFHEICIMQKIGTHPNVVTLLACCTEQEPYLLIMEYVMCGKLLTYLRDRRSRLDRFQMPLGGLTSRDLTVFAYCVARGMDYLASKGIVHRDLAARNVLVDHNKLCKIADFGMSREVNPTSSNSDDKTCKPQRNALPVRWMAPEALLYSIYNHETDVWAYGVLLWEIVTLGSTPYATMSGREVLHMVTEGYRLERPAHCKPHLYQTMHACWHADPTQRPPFSEIKRQLSELLENEPTEGNYVDLESFYQDSSVYSDPSAIIENDGGISVEYSSELSVKLRKEEIPQPSFHSSGTNLQRNFSSSNLVPRNTNLRSEVFSSVRGGSHTTVGGFGIMDGGFSGRDGNFCERKAIEKLSGTSFHREREGNPSRENGHPGNSLISRNSFNGIGNQGRSGIRAFITKSGSSRSKRISEFECDI